MAREDMHLGDKGSGEGGGDQTPPSDAQVGDDTSCCVSMTVLLVDDHALLRDMLCERLGIDAHLDVVGSAMNADQGVAEAERLRPDIVLMDVDMPGGSPFDATKKIRTRCPETKVVFLTAHCHDSYIDKALRAGASGYVVKAESPDKIVEALHLVGRGEKYFSPQVRARIIVETKAARHQGGCKTRLSLLTAREFEILRHIGKGETTKEIADATHIAAKTVGNHTSSIMDKLDIHNRVGLTRFAIREGIVDP